MTRAPKAQSSRILYYHSDHLGTPRELTNRHGNIVWTATYKAWGATQSIDYPPILQTVQNGNTVQAQWIAQSRYDRPTQNLRFQGQYFDQETGLHYNRFRYYDPDIGRFISQDPIGLYGGDNLYQYAPNPTGWIDPWGLATYNTMRSIDGFQKHHIIPQQLNSHPAIQAADINIHQSKNIIYLPTHAENHPTRTVHRGLHPNYTNNVRYKLDQIHQLGKARGWDKSQYREAVGEIISRNRQGLRSGQILLNRNSIRIGKCSCT